MSGGNDVEKIIFVSTPRTCKDCKHYNKQDKRCRLKVCMYKARR